MKIEIIVALILGTALGLGGMFFVAQLVNQKPRETPKIVLATPSPTTADSIPSKNELTDPLNLTSWDTSPLQIRGTVKTGNFVFLVGDTTDTVAVTTNGIFDTTTPPLLGVSGYRVFSSFGEKIGDAIVISYKDLQRSKKMHFGVVTDLTAEGLQMRGTDGTIEQIAYAQNIVVASFIKDSKKITTADVAIGDKVVVVGDAADKNLTVADGLFVIPSDFGITEYLLKTGTITSINKNEVVISTKDGDITVKTAPDTKYFGIKETGALRKRTKLIQTDVTRTTYITYQKDSSNIRSIFISE